MVKRFTSFLSKNKKLFFWLIIISAIIYLILPDKEQAQETISVMKSADPKWLLVANIFYYLTIPMYAMQLIVLSMSKLNS